MSIVKPGRARTKIVATVHASNAVGTINNVREVVRLAHTVGAMAYIDAVHYAPHGPIDVRALDCDFLVCSSYKFFGPHMGILYAKHEHLQRLRPYKVAANTHAIPLDWEWGTLNHECIAGIMACVDYLASLGQHIDPSHSTRRAALLTAFDMQLPEGQKPPEGVVIPEGLHYNKFFPGHAIAMPKPISDGQVDYPDGTPTTVDQYSRDVAAFLMWAAEPKLEARKEMGFKVMLFLLVLTVLLYVTKRKVWSAVEAH